MKYFVTFPSGSEVAVDVTHLPTGGVQVEVGGQVLDADTVALAGAVSTRIDGRVVDLWMEGTPPDVGVVAAAGAMHRFYAKVESERMRAAAAALGTKAASESVVTSPMPGRVLKVLCAEGDDVVTGQPLVVVEAMKMENELSSGKSGRVAKIHVKPGDTVEGRARLVEIE